MSSDASLDDCSILDTQVFSPGAANASAAPIDDVIGLSAQSPRPHAQKGRQVGVPANGDICISPWWRTWGLVLPAGGEAPALAWP
jgi:hypothetical protein